MRLTLRTLLAYLDDLLEPSQAKELGVKVQESEMAGGLVTRIRDVIRKRRLTAPVVSGPGCDLDANVVAEYLDNTLPPQGVADLEQLCLDSDVHLAEVAASHQILTLVLGEPVDIGPHSRERMYALGEAAKTSAPVVHALAGAGSQGPNGNGVTVAVKPPVVPPAPVATVSGLGPAVKSVTSSRPASTTMPATVAAAATSVERQPEESFDRTIPDYLKAPPLWQRALPLAVVMLLLVWLGMLFSDPLLSILRGKPGPATQVASANGANAPAANAAADAQTAKDAEAAMIDEGQPEDLVPSENPEGDEMPAENPAGEQVAAVTKPNVDAPPPADADEVTPAPKSASESKPAPVTPAPTTTKQAPGTAVAVVDTNKTNGNKTSPEGKAVPPAPVPMRTNPAQYISQDGVVLHYDADRLGWYQLPHRAHVFADDALAVPEPFDAQIQMGREKHRLTVMGPAVVGVIDPMNDLPMGINLLRGRVILQPAESDNAAAGAAATPLKLLLSVQGMNWHLELTDPATRCGVEVVPREPHHFEENFENAGWSGKLYLWSGSLQITDSDGKVRSMTAPDSFVLASDPSLPEAPPTPSTDLPNWERRLSTLAQKNARLFEKEFTSDESSARDSLLGLIDSRVYELSRLAVSCLGLVGDYEMMLEVLDRNEHHESRVAAINSLRSWINQAPENRDRLKAAIGAKFYPEEVATIYRLIWGYDDQDARSKQTSEELVDWLEHDRLAVRELAWFYIKSLTNRKQEIFDARGTPMHISNAVQRIRKILEKDGTLLPPLPTPKAPTPATENK